MRWEVRSMQVLMRLRRNRRVPARSRCALALTPMHTPRRFGFAARCFGETNPNEANAEPGWRIGNQEKRRFDGHSYYETNPFAWPRLSASFMDTTDGHPATSRRGIALQTRGCSHGRISIVQSSLRCVGGRNGVRLGSDWGQFLEGGLGVFVRPAAGRAKGCAARSGGTSGQKLFYVPTTAFPDGARRRCETAPHCGIGISSTSRRIRSQSCRRIADGGAGSASGGVQA